MPGRLEFEFGHGRRPPRPAAATPFRLLVLADLAGSGARVPLAMRKPVAVDIDRLDAVLERIAPRVSLAAGAERPALELGFTSLDDFHPDTLLARVPLFAERAEAATRLVASPSPAAGAPPAPAPVPTISPLDALLGGTVRPAGVERSVDVDGFIRNLLGPVGVPAADEHIGMLAAAGDEARAAALRGVLHDPAFQALEAAWRGLHRLVASVDTGPDLQVWALDLARAELAADLTAAAPALAALLSDAGGEAGWAAVLADYRFGPDEVALLAALAGLGEGLGAPVLTAALPALCGAPALTEPPSRWAPAPRAWEVLRTLPAAHWLAPALPRILLRHPYGTGSDPIDAFAFEEMPLPQRHEDYLWGNPAFALGGLLGCAFARDGWALDPDAERDIEDLPLHLRAEDGERVLQACAEVHLGETAAEAFDGLGCIAILSRRDRNAARVLRFRSAAGALAGRWRS